MTGRDELATGKISKLLLTFSLPAIIGLMVNGLYNVISRIFVGQGVGTLALSGVAIAFPINILLLAFSMLIGIGATALISIRLGQKNHAEAEVIIGNACMATLLINTSLMLLVAVFTDPILRFLGATPDMMSYAREYVLYSLPGIPIMGLGLGMNNFIRAQGHPRRAMLTQLLGAFVSVSLTPLFIFVLHWGVKGAAVATVAAQLATAVWVMHYLISPRSNSFLKLKLRNMKLKMRIVKDILSIGVASFSAQAAGAVVMVVFNNRLGYYGGEEAIAAYAVISAVSMVFLMPILGMAQGAQPIIGFNYGAKKYQRVKKTVYYSIAAASFVSVIGFFIVELFPEALIRLFGDSQEFNEVGVTGLRIFMAIFFIVGMQVIAGNYFLAVGRGLISLILTVSRQCLFLIPAVYILSNYWGLAGIWYSGPVSDFLALALTMSMFAWEMRRLSKLERLSETKIVRAES